MPLYSKKGCLSSIFCSFLGSYCNINILRSIASFDASRLLVSKSDPELARNLNYMILTC